MNFHAFLICAVSRAVYSTGYELGKGHISEHYAQYLNSGHILKSNSSKTVNIYCYKGEEKRLSAFFRSVNILISTDRKDHEPILYGGSTPGEVFSAYEEQTARWISPVLPWQKGSSFSLNPFNHSCLGVQYDEPYGIQLVYKRISYFRVIPFVIGLLLFFWAPTLAVNPGFFYGTGVLTGVLASLLLLVYFAVKLSPVKRVGGIVSLATFLGGFSLVVYFMNAVWSNFSDIMVNYQQYLVTYVMVAGVVSFYVCYRVGPLENERSIHLLQWTLQGCGLLLIFACSYHQEASVAIMILILTVYNIPKRYIGKVRAYWLRKFPPRVKLLTEDEYHEEGVKETKKALEQLRNYAGSPECNAWKVVSRLKTPLSQERDVRRKGQSKNGSFVEFYSEPRVRRRSMSRDVLNLSDFVILVPKNTPRFAEFVEGGSHLTDGEILQFDSEAEPPMDDDSRDDSDESFSGEDISLYSQ